MVLAGKSRQARRWRCRLIRRKRRREGESERGTEGREGERDGEKEGEKGLGWETEIPERALMAEIWLCMALTYSSLLDTWRKALLSRFCARNRALSSAKGGATLFSTADNRWIMPMRSWSVGISPCCCGCCCAVDCGCCCCCCCINSDSALDCCSASKSRFFRAAR